MQHFFRPFWRRMESTSQLPSVLVCQFTVSFPTSKLCYICFSYNYIFFMTLGLRSFVVRCITCGNNIITYGNYVSLLFVIVTYFLFCQNYVIYLFGVVTFFNDVRITLFFGTFELCMEMTWKLRFVFVRHCEVLFITLQLRYLFFRCSYVFRRH